MRTAGVLRPRRWFVLTLLAATLPVISCQQKGNAPTGGQVPEAADSGLFLFAHVRGQDLLKSPIVEQIRKDRLQIDGKELRWEDLEQMAAAQFGIKPSQVESITFAMPEVPDKRSDENKFILIVVSRDDLDRDALRKKLGNNPSKIEGYTALQPGLLLHFPDAKTLVVLHEHLVGRYEDGYEKDRDAWPFNVGLRKAANAHSIVAAFNIDKLPAQARAEVRESDLQKLLAARSVVVGVDLKEEGVAIGARGEFHDGSSAKAAGQAIGNLTKTALGMMAEQMRSPRFKQDYGFLLKPLQNVRDAAEAMKVDTDGKSVTASTMVRTDFSVATTVTGAVLKVREAAARATSMNNLNMIALCLHNYYNQMSLLPIVGTDAKGVPIKDLKAKANLSWRVAILPYIEQEQLYNQFKFDEPWDSEHNKKLIQKMPKFFAPTTSTKAKPGETHYQMVIGPKVLRPGIKIEAVSDGLSNTIAVVEAAEPVIWTKPDDVSIPGDKMPDDLLARFGGMFPNGFNAAFMDGAVRFISKRGLKAEQLWAALTPDGGEVLDLP